LLVLNLQRAFYYLHIGPEWASTFHR